MPRVTIDYFDTIAKLEALPAPHRANIAKAALPNFERAASHAHAKAIKARNALFSPRVLSETAEHREERLTTQLQKIHQHPQWVQDEVIRRITRPYRLMSPAWQRLMLWAETHGHTDPLQFAHLITLWSENLDKGYPHHATTVKSTREHKAALGQALKREGINYALAVGQLDQARRIARGMSREQWSEAHEADRRRQARAAHSDIDEDQAIAVLVAARAIPTKFMELTPEMMDRLRGDRAITAD